MWLYTPFEKPGIECVHCSARNATVSLAEMLGPPIKILLARVGTVFKKTLNKTVPVTGIVWTDADCVSVVYKIFSPTRTVKKPPVWM